jgi:hypothetical protein
MVGNSVQSQRHFNSVSNIWYNLVCAKILRWTALRKLRGQLGFCPNLACEIIGIYREREVFLRAFI